MGEAAVSRTASTPLAEEQFDAVDEAFRQSTVNSRADLVKSALLIISDRVINVNEPMDQSRAHSDGHS